MSRFVVEYSAGSALNADSEAENRIPLKETEDNRIHQLQQSHLEAEAEDFRVKMKAFVFSFDESSE